MKDFLNNLANSPTNLAYLAGYFDGEGCVYVQKPGKWRRYPDLCISVCSADLETLQLFAETFGGTVIKNKPQFLTKRQTWRWSKGSSKAQEILRALLPFLRAKREQSELALQFTFGRKTIKPAAEEIEKRLGLLDRICAINQRVTVGT